MNNDSEELYGISATDIEPVPQELNGENKIMDFEESIYGTSKPTRNVTRIKIIND